MAGRKAIEKRLIDIENGIGEIKEKLCEMEPCVPKDEDVATTEPGEEE